MASFTVRQGLNLERRLPTTQMLLIGRKSILKSVDFANETKLMEKLSHSVDAELFKKAKEQLLASGNGSVPLYLNLAKLVSIPDDLSRYNSPSNSYTLTKEAKAIKMAKDIKDLSIVLFTDFQNAMASVAALARAFPQFSMKTKSSNPPESVEVELMLTDGKSLSDKDLAFLQSLSENVRACCRLGDMPPNLLHSEALLEEALSMVKALGVHVETTIIKGEDLLHKGFGGIYSVGQAAKYPPVFACFSWKPTGASRTFALVGKGIVYDTGGLSLKGKTAMPSMKIDMAGAAAQLGAFCTLVKAEFSQNLHCLLCVAENQISPEATRPDDVIRMLSGMTVEVNNTDAEGRMVLADGVFYAREKLKADTIIDMATLTGAQSSATGKYHSAILCNSDELERECVKAGRKSGDLAHPLPFAPELYFSDLASKVADMKNACLGTQQGPPSALAGLFIGKHIDFGFGKAATANNDGKPKEKAGDAVGAPVDWLHIDMAGCTSICWWEGRATGYGVALVCALLSKHTDVEVAK